MVYRVARWFLAKRRALQTDGRNESGLEVQSARVSVISLLALWIQYVQVVGQGELLARLACRHEQSFDMYACMWVEGTSISLDDLTSAG